jgi:choline dehydrogenase-like flavoprotein
VFADLRSLDQGAVLDADLCVIGAGAAGITLARAFAGTDLRLVVVESGGLTPDDATQQLYRGRSVGVDNSPLHGSRLRYLGGSTNHWNGWCAPADRLDLAARPWIPHSGWPLRLEDLVPHYEEGRRLLGLDPVRFENVADIEDEEPSDVTEARADDADDAEAALPLDPRRLRTAFWQIDHPPTRFGEAFRGELAAAANVIVLLWANVVDIARSRERAAVEHVEVASLGGRRARVRARRFVLACGGLENPRLLLAANGVERDGLGNRHGLVGRFFMDHFQVELAAIYAGRAERFELLRQRRRASGISYRPGLCLAAALQRREEVANPVAFLGPRRRRAALQPQDDPARAEETRRMLDALVESVTGESPGDDGPAPPWDGEVIHMFGNPTPDPASRVRLGAERDALGVPRLELDWRLGEADRRSVGVLAHTLGSELYRVGAGRLRLARWLRAGAPDDDSWLDGVTGANHPMGTTRMALDPRQGVTDADARVHGIENLYVAGSSLFPTAIRPNPTLTLVALTLRLADHLAREMGAARPVVR